MKDERIKDVVKDRYSQIAERSQQSCCSGCGCGVSPSALAEAVGYSKQDLEGIPDEASLGLGCGNPTAIAELREGETVLDLGSGAGMDVFLAANKVGPAGTVIGVDMTEAMIDKASAIAMRNGLKNVEFRLGEIEKLPVEDNCVDTIISNCAINLSPNKSKVFSEAYRVLKPEGKLIVSDIVAERALPDGMKEDLEAWAGCIAGALEQNEYLEEIRVAGFGDLQIVANGEFHAEDLESGETVKLLSVSVKAYKP